MRTYCYVCGRETLDSRIYFNNENRMAYAHAGSGGSLTPCEIAMVRDPEWHNEPTWKRMKRKERVGMTYPAPPPPPGYEEELPPPNIQTW